MNQSGSGAVQQELQEIALIDILALLWRRRWLMLSIIVLTTALGVLAAYLITPVYRSTVVMLPAQTNENSNRLGGLMGQLGGLAALAGVSASDSIQSEEALATLTSRLFTEKFIEELNLLPVLFEPAWDSERQEWLAKDPQDAPSMTDGVNFVENVVRTVVRDNDTGLLRLHIVWRDPQVAADWANKMVEMVNLHLRQKAVVEAEKSLEYLNDELSKTTTIEVRSTMFGLMEHQIRSTMLAHIRDEYAFKVIDPGVPSEIDDFIRPNRLLLVVLGLAAGILLAMFLAIILAFFEKNLGFGR